MSRLGPCYLIYGDDHGAVAERRARLRALAHTDGDGASVESLDGDEGTPAGVASALRVMTFAVGRRVIIVDGVERWKEAEVKEHLAGAMKEMPPDTTLALFAREEGRAKAPALIHKLIKAAGGHVVAHSTVKPWELPKWVREQGGTQGLALDAAAAKTLVGLVGDRQQRLLRELEKLALEHGVVRDGAPVVISVEEIEERAAHSAQWRVFSLIDALIAGDGKAAIRTYLQLRDQGERLTGLTYLIAKSLRDALAVSLRLQGGESTGEVKRGLRMSPRVADRYLADVSRSSPERLRRALAALADLEVDSRGGAVLSSSRSVLSSMSEDTLALSSIENLVA
jgi:DNA polymerase III subunit delta